MLRSPRCSPRRRAPGSPPARALALPLLLALAAAAGGCGRPAGKSLVIITLDTTRADHLGCYGYPLPTTPNLDELARQGVVFENAYAPMPQTLPSHATLFTGLPPRLHGALENAMTLEGGVTTLAEIMAGRDYETAAFIGARVLEDTTGIEQGFQVFDLPTGRQRDLQHPVERRADAVTDAALSWALAKHFTAKPFLLWAHYFDPHGPYEPKQERIALDAVAPVVAARPDFAGLPPEKLAEYAALWHGYDNELAYMDAQVGRLLAGLRTRKMLDDAIILVVGDHGEGLWEHQEKGHGATVFEELMRVPLIVVLPDGQGAGRRVAAQVQMQDLFPTLLRLAELGDASGLPGIDLSGALRQGVEPEGRPVFVERPHYTADNIRAGRAEAHGWGFGVLAGVVAGGKKLVRYPPDESGAVRHELYDLAADPSELKDLSAERPDEVGALSEALDEWLERYPIAELGAAPPMTPERERTLRELGYIK